MSNLDNKDYNSPYQGAGEQPGGSGPVGQPRPQWVAIPVPKLSPNVTYTLIGVTVAVFLLQQLSGDLLFLYGGKINSLILAGQLWRLVTPMFLHGSILHILFNMYALYALGPGLERAYGHWRFLALYLLSGFAGNALSFLLSPNPSLGSSTAVFGLVAAQGVFVYQNRRFFAQQARSILTNTIGVVIVNLLIGISPGSNIDNFGHLGGLMGGLIFALLGGPLWDVEGLPPNVSLKDRREGLQVQLAIIAVLLVFGGLVAYKFFT